MTKKDATESKSNGLLLKLPVRIGSGIDDFSVRKFTSKAGAKLAVVTLAPHTHVPGKDVSGFSFVVSQRQVNPAGQAVPYQHTIVLSEFASEKVGGRWVPDTSKPWMVTLTKDNYKNMGTALDPNWEKVGSDTVIVTSKELYVGVSEQIEGYEKHRSERDNQEITSEVQEGASLASVGTEAKEASEMLAQEHPQTLKGRAHDL